MVWKHADSAISDISLSAIFLKSSGIAFTASLSSRSFEPVFRSHCFSILELFHIRVNLQKFRPFFHVAAITV